MNNISSLKTKLVDNFKSMGRSTSTEYKTAFPDRLDTIDEGHLVLKQERNLNSQDGNAFMQQIHLYTASEVTPAVMADLRKKIPLYSITLAPDYAEKKVFRGMHLSDDILHKIRFSPLGFASRDVAHGLMHGFLQPNGMYIGCGVTSVSTLFTVAASFAKTKKQGEHQVMINIHLMGDRPGYYQTGAKGIAMRTSNLPTISGNPSSEHEIILDITNRYEIAGCRYYNDMFNVDINAFGPSRDDVEALNLSTDKWPQISGAKGSHPGGIFLNDAGKHVYVKIMQDKAHAKNEVLASRLYALAGVPAVQLREATRSGKPALTSLYDSTLAPVIPPKGHTSLGGLKGLHEGFVVDAWLANWDVIGTDNDNIMSKNRQAFRIDVGGALLFRALGSPKGERFTDSAKEIYTLLNPSANRSAADAFCMISRNDIKAGIARLAKIDDMDIMMECLKYAPGRREERIQLGLKLVKRKRAIQLAGQQNLPHFHPKRNDQDRLVYIEKLSHPSLSVFWQHPGETLTFTPDAPVPSSLNGIPFAVWPAPTRDKDWNKVTTSQHHIATPPFVSVPGKKTAAGAVVCEPDGRVWLCEPTNHYGGYSLTIPKGKTSPSILGLDVTAVKEVYEETGLRVKLTAFIGDVERDTSKARYFLAERVSGTPADQGWESQSVKLMTFDNALAKLPSGIDRSIIKHARSLKNLS